MNTDDTNKNQPMLQTKPMQTGQPISTQTGTTSHVVKEHEPAGIVPSEVIQEVTGEVELPKEVEAIGVQKIHETIELPPDMKKIGITHVGPSVPMKMTTIPAVVLPISDKQVVVGLHTHVSNALRWLAQWCIKKLKKAHIALKVIHGKIIRVREKS